MKILYYWFISKNIKAYDIWRAGCEFKNKKLFLDRKDGTVFLTDFSI